MQALNQTKAKAQLLSRIQREAAKEREVADQRRLARHRKQRLRERKIATTRATRMRRSAKYLEDVRVDLLEHEGQRRERSMMKAEECPLARRLRETEAVMIKRPLEETQAYLFVFRQMPKLSMYAQQQ